MQTHMFCNAHLDPVWLWQWESGMSEAISTFRTAADLVDEYPDFIFNHNESLLYEWIEEHEPELFERIQRQVKEGRWKIVGGWFLQPDCNIPSGESIFRQVLRGRLYFYDKFGKVPVTAVNFDSFGHAQGLVQMFRQCGYKYYVNIRPGKDNYDFESEDFIWRGYEGSEILVHRSDKGYNSVLGNAGEELKGWMEEHKNEKTAMYLWGVGNHGGGPSRKDLNDIAQLQKNGMDLIHSTPDAYFATVDRNSLPVVERGLNPMMEGCYTSIIRIKQMHRRLENDLVLVEKMAAHAELAGLSTYEKALIDDAWRDLLFAEFHDALPGSCIQPVEEDTIRILNHGLEIMSRLKAKYCIALSAGQEKVSDGDTVPLMVYNPHPFDYKGKIDAEYLLPRQIWHKEFSNPVVYLNGKRLPGQSAKESGNFNMDWCKRVVFEAELPAASLTRFDIRFETLSKRPEPMLTADSDWQIIVPTSRGKVAVDARSGLVSSYVVDGVEYLKPGALSVDVFPDSYNCWGGQRGYDFLMPIGRFVPMTHGQATDFSGVKGGIVDPVRVTDEGEVCTVIEADMQYNHSKLLMRYIVNRNVGSLEVEARVFNMEKEKRMKLMIPAAIENVSRCGQTIFGREALDSTGGERVSQYWQALSNEKHALTIINDGVYGANCIGGRLGISLLRSAGYGAGASTWGEPFHDPMYQPRMDQGERRYRFVLMGGDSAQRLRAIDREAAAFNQAPYAMAFCPSGAGEKPKTLIRIDGDNAALSCFKQSERDENVYILRVFECQGRGADAHIVMPLLGHVLDVKLKPFEIKTFRVTREGVEETDMLEGAIDFSDQ